METYLRHCKKFNEIHIEHFNSVLQRQLPTHAIVDFEAVLHSAERAGINYNANLACQEALGYGKHKSEQATPQSLVYHVNAMKDRLTIDTTKRILKKVFALTNTIDSDGPAQFHIDTDRFEASESFTQKLCQMSASEAI